MCVYMGIAIYLYHNYHNSYLSELQTNLDIVNQLL